MSHKFAITDGVLTNLYKKKLIANNFEMIDRVVGSEHGYNFEDSGEIGTPTSSDDIEDNERIDIYLSNKNIVRYLYPHQVDLYNHLINIQVFTDYCQLYLDIRDRYPGMAKKHLFDSYVYDVAADNYNFELLGDRIKKNLNSDKKYIVKPYNYNDRITEDRIILNRDRNILDYVMANKFNCSKWIFMKKIRLSKQRIKVFSLIGANSRSLSGYIYPEINDSEGMEINEDLKQQIYKVIKKIYIVDFSKIMFGKFCKKAFEILCFEFLVTANNRIKLNNLTIRFEKELVEQTYFHKLVDNVLNLMVFNKDNLFEKIVTRKYKPFNERMVISFTSYYCDRIENKLDELNRLKENIKKYRLQFIYDIPFNAIQNPKKIDNLYKGRYTAVIRGTDDYKQYNEMTNIIIERCNVRCRFGNSKTMLELSQDPDNIKKIMMRLYEEKKDINYKKVASEIYKQTKICSYFPINMVYGFIKHFGAKSMLDISTGWGDRLIAACMADIIYYGADPNTCNVPYYTQMIELFGNREKQKFTTIGFENLEINDTYDLIFSSPPFFELEKYSTDKAQSYLKYTTSSAWVHDFLFVVIRKAWKYLKNGGHMCLYMNDYYKLLYCEEMINFCIKRLDRCKYLGVIGFTMMKDRTPEDPPVDNLKKIRVQPLWVFYKK